MTSSPSNIRLQIIEMYDVPDETVFFDPPSIFDSAIIGLGYRGQGDPVLVYDRNKVLENMAREFAPDTSAEDPMEEAIEFFEYNTMRSSHGEDGEYTPIFMTPLYGENDELLDLTLHQS